jgi:hypothetical protein
MLPQADGYHRRRSNGACCFHCSLDKSIYSNILDDATLAWPGRRPSAL